MSKSLFFWLSPYCEAFFCFLYPPFCSHCRAPLEDSSSFFCSICVESIEHKDKLRHCSICYQAMQGRFCCPPTMLTLSHCCFEKEGPFETLVKLVKGPLGKERFAKLIASFLLMEMEKKGILCEETVLIPLDTAFRWRFSAKTGIDAFICKELISLYPRFSLACPLYKSSSKKGALTFFPKSAEFAQRKIAVVISLEHPKKEIIQEVLGKLLCLPWRALSLFSFCSK